MDDDVNFRERHPLVRYVIIGVIVLIIAGFVTAIVIANNESNSNSSNTSHSSSSQAKKAPSPTSASQQATNKPAPNSVGSTTSPVSAPPQSLTNTGSGNVIILFATTTLITSMVHYGYRRLRKI